MPASASIVPRSLILPRKTHQQTLSYLWNETLSEQDRLLFPVGFSVLLLMPSPLTLFLYRLDVIFPNAKP